MEWKLAEAKSRLSELVTRATTEGPQTIRRHDDTVIVLAEPTYRALLGEHKRSFKDWLMNGPRTDGLEIPAREAAPMRELNL